MKRPAKNITAQGRTAKRVWYIVAGGVVILGTIILLLQTKIIVFYNNPDGRPTTDELGPPPFPVSVDPKQKTITESRDVDLYMNSWIASNHTKPKREQGWLALLTDQLLSADWYQHLASPISRILVIRSGERAEQVADSFAEILDWSTAEKEIFLQKMQTEVPPLPDGKLYPGRYIFDKDATPETVALAVADRFNAEVRTRYTSEIEAMVPLRDTLIIASLIEREAYDFTDMRYISGIIWNRLFIDMKLQIDATLQYAQGASAVDSWWPVPKPADKFLDSPYNTYQHAGLPPGPISNPSIDAIIAALNPRQTDCLFYFHQNDGTFHCSETYEQHVSLLKQFFGQGK